MTIKLNEILKRVRKEKGNTQEELAKYLNISVQSVSKWECGDGYPDITLLPAIAAYYSITIDTLLGVDENEKNKRIEEITKEYNRIRAHKHNPNGTLFKEHGLDEGIELMRKAVREFPDCYFFTQLLASDLWWKAKSCTDSMKTELLEEAEILCDRIMIKCTEERYRHCASSILCMIYNDSGRREMALENAYQSCDIVDSIDWKLAKIYTGEELKKQLRRNIREFMKYLYLSVKQMHEAGGDFGFARENKEMMVQFKSITDYLL